MDFQRLGVAISATPPWGSDVPKSFDPDGMREPLKGYRPVCAAMSRDGPWHIAEGSHRSHALWKGHVSGRADCQDTFRVILGVHPMMRTWWNFLA